MAPTTRLILEDGTPERRHRQRLSQLLTEYTEIIRVCSPYITERQLLTVAPKRKVRLLTSLLPLDVASGATSIESINALLELGVQCRCLPSRPRLHAKVYVFGTSCAVISSANFTVSAFDSNIEAGTEVTGTEAEDVAKWFDRLWDSASPITVEQLADLQRQTSKLRREFAKLKARAKSATQSRPVSKAKIELTDSLQQLFTTATRFFVCNTDRREGTRTATGGFLLEEEMHNRGFAAAWEEYKFPSHMEAVQPGDAIFMFAKGVGIIGVGVATGLCQTLTSSQPGRLTHVHTTVEWRVPTRWLAWTDAEGAYPWKSPNFTFWDVSESKYDDLRDGVMKHFLTEE